MKNDSLNRVERLFLHQSFVYLLSGLGAALIVALCLSFFLLTIRIFNLDTKIFSMLFGVATASLAAGYLYGLSEITYRIRHKRFEPFISSVLISVERTLNDRPKPRI